MNFIETVALWVLIKVRTTFLSSHLSPSPALLRAGHTVGAQYKYANRLIAQPVAPEARARENRK